MAWTYFDCLHQKSLTLTESICWMTETSLSFVVTTLGCLEQQFLTLQLLVSLIFIAYFFNIVSFLLVAFLLFCACQFLTSSANNGKPYLAPRELLQWPALSARLNCLRRDSTIYISDILNYPSFFCSKRVNFFWRLIYRLFSWLTISILVLIAGRAKETVRALLGWWLGTAISGMVNLFVCY